jgi:Holliday junction DNA helicase RuvA
VAEETYQVLVSLGHPEAEARRLLETPLASKKKFKSVEDLLQAVYEQNQ